jgi:hypothetical protein
MVKFGKALVFVNLAIGIGLFAWALAVYTNRLDYFDRKDAVPPVEGRFTTLGNEIKTLTESIARAQTAFALKAEYARQYEYIRDDRLTKLNARLALVRQGNNPSIHFHQQVLLKDPAFPGLIYLGNPGQPDNNPGPVVKGLRSNDLQGLGYLQSEMEKKVREETATIKRIIEARKKLEELSAKVESVQTELFKQKDIRGNLTEEKAYLADVQVNWNERLKVLEQRNQQLGARLKALGVAANADGGK